MSDLSTSESTAPINEYAKNYVDTLFLAFENDKNRDTDINNPLNRNNLQKFMANTDELLELVNKFVEKDIASSIKKNTAIYVPLVEKDTALSIPLVRTDISPLVRKDIGKSVKKDIILVKKNVDRADKKNCIIS